MTTIPNDADLNAQHAERVESLTEAGPLPTVEEIAGPIVRGVYLLGGLAYRTHDLEMLAEFGPDRDNYRRQAIELVDLVARVCDIVAGGCESHMAGEDRGHGGGQVADVLERVAGTRGLRDWLYSSIADGLVHGNGTLVT